MADVVAKFTLKKTEPIKSNFTLKKAEKLDANFTLVSGTIYHDRLLNRDLPDQHPMSAITGLEDEIARINADIVAEKERAEGVESQISNTLSEEVNRLDVEDARLDAKINDETTRAEQAESDISGNLVAEKTRAETRENEIDEKLDGINVNLTKQIDDLEQDVNDKYNELVRDIDDLTDVVEEDFSSLNTKIDNSVTTINQRITDVADELGQTIEENVVALQAEDTALQNQINTHSQTLTAHDGRITSNTNAITKEIVDRESADNGLQEQIDAIVSSSDVKDIVGTYAELQAYDKSTLGNNDIIKVLQDETQQGASTYYKFKTETQSFDYIGKEGPYYTKSEADNLLNQKQDNIEDLEQIRTNAQTGANLVTQVETNKTDIATLSSGKANIDLDNLSTTGLAKVTYTAGDGIEVRNNVIYNTRTSAEWGKVQGDIDEQVDLKEKLDSKQDNLDIVLLAGAVIND